MLKKEFVGFSAVADVKTDSGKHGKNQLMDFRPYFGRFYEKIVFSY